MTQRDDGWFVLPLEGMQAVSAERERLLVRDGEDEAEIPVPENWDADAASLVADSAVVLEALVSPQGWLEIMFTGGRGLTIAPLEEVEAWEVRGPGDVFVVCTPGGGEPAIWDATSKTYTLKAGEPLPPEAEEALQEMYDAFGVPPLFSPAEEDREGEEE